MGLFETDTIPNDITEVIKALDEYNGIAPEKENANA